MVKGVNKDFSLLKQINYLRVKELNQSIGSNFDAAEEIVAIGVPVCVMVEKGGKVCLVTRLVEEILDLVVDSLVIRVIGVAEPVREVLVTSIGVTDRTSVVGGSKSHG